MKLLYGSQNFGFDLPDSDEDWMELRIPTWQDILNNQLCSGDYSTSTGIVKVRDIRQLPVMLEKANINDLQILYAQKKYDCERLQWFLDNRHLLIRANPYRFLCANAAYLEGQLWESGPKCYARAEAVARILSRYMDGEYIYEIRDESLQEFRQRVHTEEDRQRLLTVAVNARQCSEEYRGCRNEELLLEVRNRVIDIIYQELRYL